MALYLVRGTYTAEAVQAIQATGAASRAEAVKQLVESVGGTLVCGPAWSTNNLAAVAVFDLPSDAALASVIVTAVASDTGPTVEVERLLSAEEVDAGIGLSPDFRAPGE